MRPLLAAFATLSVLTVPLLTGIVAATPAFAESGETSSGLAESLPSRTQIERTTTALDRLATALMDVRVGGMIAALDPEDPAAYRHRDDTLGDMARRDDPRADEKIHRNIRMLGIGMNALADRIAFMAPEMERSVRDMKRSFKRSLRQAPPRDDGR